MNHVTAAVTITSSSTTMVKQEIHKISQNRPTYGTRRIAAILTRALGKRINRKRAHRIFRKIGSITPSKSKKDIIRSKYPR
ncbi:MAG TPA: IS3 family transposase [Nitrososphaeraceae archaeon]|nr:IS3 family transposase [Nitrososphaeraceae archaeon]